MSKPPDALRIDEATPDGPDLSGVGLGKTRNVMLFPNPPHPFDSGGRLDPGFIRSDVSRAIGPLDDRAPSGRPEASG